MPSRPQKTKRSRNRMCPKTFSCLFAIAMVPARVRFALRSGKGNRLQPASYLVVRARSATPGVTVAGEKEEECNKKPQAGMSAAFTIQQIVYLTNSTTFAKTFGSFLARSASIFLSNFTFFALSKGINLL